MVEFGKRRMDIEPARAPVAASAPRVNFRLPPVEPVQFLHGAGFVVLGYVLGMLLINTLIPIRGPEFKRFVFVPAEERRGLIKEEFKPVVKKLIPPGSSNGR